MLFDRSGRRANTFLRNVSRLSATECTNWAVTGPRTMQWLCERFGAQEQPPTKRHWWFRHTLGLSAAAEGMEEHLFISEVLEVALGYDSLNVGELQCFEMLARRYQMWEQLYGQALRDADARTSTASSFD